MLGNNNNQASGLNQGILNAPHSAPRTLLDLLKETQAKITSFDIEGTGVVGPRTSITQVGFSSGFFEDAGVRLWEEQEHTITGAVQPKYHRLSDVPADEIDDIRAAARALNISPEEFIKIPTEQDYLRAHTQAGAEEFGKQQAQRGSFSPMLADYRNRALGLQNSVLTLTQSLDQIEEALTREPGVLLIQNTDYENQMYQSKQGVVGLESEAQYLSQERMRQFNLNVRGISSQNNIFSDSPFDRRYVNPMRETIRKLKAEYNSNNDITKIESLLEQLQKDTTEFQRATFKHIERSLQEGRVPVLDLMDFTSALQNRLANTAMKDVLAAHSLQITAPMLMRNRSIETLSEVLLGEEEVHTALSDARQQNLLFHKVLQMTDEVEDGVLSPDTINYIRAMNDPDNYNKDFLKTVKSQLTDIQLTASKMAQEGKTLQEIHSYIVRAVPDKLSKTLRYYEGTPVNEFNRGLVLDQIQNFIVDPENTTNPLDGDIQEKDGTPKARQSEPKSSVANDAQEALKDTQSTTESTPPKHANSSTTYRTSQQKLDNVIQSITRQQSHVDGIKGINNRLIPPSVVSTQAAKKLARDIPNKTGIPTVGKLALAGLGSMAFLNMMAFSNDKRRDDETLIKNDTYDAIYGNLYIGQGYADWRERSNSHKMVY